MHPPNGYAATGAGIISDKTVPAVHNPSIENIEIPWPFFPTALKTRILDSIGSAVIAVNEHQRILYHFKKGRNTWPETEGPPGIGKTVA